LEQLVSEACGPVTAAAASLLAVHRLSEPLLPPAIAGCLPGPPRWEISKLSSCLSLDGMAWIYMGAGRRRTNPRSALVRLDWGRD
jgi:hypothetical protein